MCLICECDGDYKQLEEIEVLNCSNCPHLTAIPYMAKLETLWCTDCPQLATIAVNPDLFWLVCSRCPRLSVIPFNASLLHVCYDNCPLAYTQAALQRRVAVRSRTCGRHVRDWAQRARVRAARKRRAAAELRALSQDAFVAGVIQIVLALL